MSLRDDSADLTVVHHDQRTNPLICHLLDGIENRVVRMDYLDIVTFRFQDLPYGRHGRLVQFSLEAELSCSLSTRRCGYLDLIIVRFT
jgi:hypothetical protein